MKHYEIKEGEGYFSVNEAFVTIVNEDEEQYTDGYAEVLIVEMYWGDSYHAEKEVFVKGYGFNGKVYDSKEEVEKDGYELTHEDSMERNLWDFETLEEAEKYALERLKKRAEEYSFD